MRPRYVSVIGASVCGAEIAALAKDVGSLLAARQCIVVCGGLGGVMEAAAQGAKEAGGTCLGVLPSLDRAQASSALTLSVCTGIGHARNLGVVASGDVVIAIGGAWGTLSEIGLARAIGRDVVALGSWTATPAGDKLDGVHVVESPAEAVELALSLVESPDHE